MKHVFVLFLCLLRAAICMGGQGPPYKINTAGMDPNDLLRPGNSEAPKNEPSGMKFDL